MLPTLSPRDARVALDGGARLVDIRGADEFARERIPGAVNLPTTAHVDERGMLREPDALRRTFAERGITDGVAVGAYCGSGITAAHTALVLAEIGIDAKLFHGSWSQWSNTPGRPVATGE